MGSEIYMTMVSIQLALNSALEAHLEDGQRVLPAQRDTPMCAQAAHLLQQTLRAALGGRRVLRVAHFDTLNKGGKANSCLEVASSLSPSQLQSEKTSL